MTLHAGDVISCAECDRPLYRLRVDVEGGSSWASGSTGSPGLEQPTMHAPVLNCPTCGLTIAYSFTIAEQLL